MTIRKRHLVFWGVTGAVALITLLLLPLDGTVLLLSSGVNTTNLPLIQLEPAHPVAGELTTVTVVDSQYWPFTQFTVNGDPAIPVDVPDMSAQVYTWSWTFFAPVETSYAVQFYVDCHTGCQQRDAVYIGDRSITSGNDTLPSKLGVVMPNPNRDWHGRNGWVVELTYATQSEQTYWGIDDLASRVHLYVNNGLNVIIRVDYDPQQSMPVDNDDAALREYLAYLQRLAGDDRLRDVHGYVIGSDMNVSHFDSGQQAITPEWYARLFLGYGEPMDSTDNAVQMIRNENPLTRVIVGPVRPWVEDSGGVIPDFGDAPWLVYMRILVMVLDETLTTRAGAGIPVSFDGFDVQAPANLSAVAKDEPLESEPYMHLYHEVYPDAHMGFRVYEDWLDIINAYSSTSGLPVYIISTNTYERETDATPDETYVQGWLTNALHTVNGESQIKAMCWFLDDFPNTDQWDAFSLTKAPGKLQLAAEEFDHLLQIEEQ